MAITQDGGHMIHSTVKDVGPERSPATTTTGGEIAKSNQTRLIAAYPKSPMLGTEADYTAVAVASLKANLLKNTVLPGDMAAAQGYYGWSDGESSEEIPSSGDLTYSGAPDITAVVADKEGNAIASPYMPNLLPPDSFNPKMDNETAVVLSPAESFSATTPFVGDGLLSPNGSSAALQAKTQPPDDSGTEAGPTPDTAGSGGDGSGGG